MPARRVLSDEQAAEVRALYEGGCTQKEIAESFSVSRQVVVRLLKGQTYGRQPTSMRKKGPRVVEAEVRFWEKVNKDGPVQPHMETCCWVWTASLDDVGYGRIWDGERQVLAHRFSYLLARGVLANSDVCHHCDTPACVRPDHLFDGTHLENMTDAKEKGRMQHGEAHSHAKLSDLAVIEVRQSSEPQAVQARRFGVSQSHISNIRNNKARKVGVL